jgi:hypothetical protein
MKRQFYDVTPGMARGALFHRDRIKVSYVLFGFSFFLAWLCLAFPPFRYLSYAVPVFVLLVSAADRSISFGPELKPFGMVLVAALVLSPLSHEDGWKDIFFIFAGISVAMMGNMPTVRLWTLFWWFIGGFAYLYGVWGSYKSGIHFDIIKSESTFESNYSFVFALLVPFAMSKGAWLLALLSMAFAVLTLKRIAILAALISGLFVLLGPKRGKWILNAPVMLMGNLMVLLLDMAYTLGMLDSWIHRSTGQSANELGMGRKAMHHYVVQGLVDEPLMSFMGRGMGAVYSVAEQGFGVYEKVNLHSDLLKLNYEIGYIFTAITFCLMYLCKDYMLRVGFLFFNILFFTDNTLIYYFFLFFFVLIMRMQREGRLEA